MLAASLFLRLLALVAGHYYFQVVIDKVLVHDAQATLDVLALGLVLVALFEAVLGGLRTWLFSHTATRIDVLLGCPAISQPLVRTAARLLPVAAGRYGGGPDARETGAHPELVAGSALALVLDSLFGVVFLAIMYAYSATLCCVVLATLRAYVLLSLFVTPVLRRRLDEKFQSGAREAGCLTNPSWRSRPSRRSPWRRRCSAASRSSSRPTSLRRCGWCRSATSPVRLRACWSRLSGPVLLLWMGARLVLDHELWAGELVASICSPAV